MNETEAVCWGMKDEKRCSKLISSEAISCLDCESSDIDCIPAYQRQLHTPERNHPSLNYYQMNRKMKAAATRIPMKNHDDEKMNEEPDTPPASNAPLSSNESENESSGNKNSDENHDDEKINEEPDTPPASKAPLSSNESENESTGDKNSNENNDDEIMNKELDTRPASEAPLSSHESEKESSGHKNPNENHDDAKMNEEPDTPPASNAPLSSNVSEKENSGDKDFNENHDDEIMNEEPDTPPATNVGENHFNENHDDEIMNEEMETLPASDVIKSAQLKRRCRTCRHDVENYQKFCNNCGDKIGAPCLGKTKGNPCAEFLSCEIKFCSNCGTANPDNITAPLSSNESEKESSGHKNPNENHDDAKMNEEPDTPPASNAPLSSNESEKENSGDKNFNENHDDEIMNEEPDTPPATNVGENHFNENHDDEIMNEEMETLPASDVIKSAQLKRRCRTCRHDVENYQKFCNNCGDKIERLALNLNSLNNLQCDNCRSTTDKSQKFCEECGHAIKNESKKITCLGMIDFTPCANVITYKTRFCPNCGTKNHQYESGENTINDSGDGCPPEVKVPSAVEEIRVDIASFKFDLKMKYGGIKSLAQSLSKHTESSKRTKLDEDFENGEQDGMSKEKVLSEIKKKVDMSSDHFEDLKNAVKFYISSDEPYVGEMNELISFIENQINPRKFEALLLSLPSLTEEVIQKKYQSLQKSAVLLAVRFAVFYPLFFKIEENIKAEIEMYFQTFELNTTLEKNVKDLKHRFSEGICHLLEEFDNGVSGMWSPRKRYYFCKTFMMNLIDELLEDAKTMYKHMLNELRQ
ncbi:unnamed protein product [Mytilus edulis]|uniref:DZANK-type domain-containing protein n=1 Tax=Mytilus edulis TaxID=6550 RepID=A0A8S3U6D7_MYTED|nr:unnamed protein product [Mytilus edulis]